jgi:1,5-anhydro-D-fructose reductase (1,5-anhydro-D-mannitol-forming)
MIGVGMLSYWHVHAWEYTGYANEHADSKVVAVWDELADRGRAAAEKLGVPFYADLAELLAQGDVQGVVVDAPTNMHRDVMVAAANAGKHIFTEKVVAATVAEVNEIMAAINQAGVKLTVSLPRLNAGYTQAITKLLAEGAVGTVTQVRVRLSHNGALPNPHSKDGWLPAHFYSKEQCLGGALIDLGCHPMYLTRLFLGAMPASIHATYGYVTGREVEDNAVATLRTASGAIGIVEAGFVNPNSPFAIEVHGTAGTLMYGTPEAKLLLQRAGEKVWSEVALPADLPNAYNQWVGHVLNNTVASENVQLALELTALMDAANRSAASGAAVKL